MNTRNSQILALLGMILFIVACQTDMVKESQTMPAISSPTPLGSQTPAATRLPATFAPTITHMPPTLALTPTPAPTIANTNDLLIEQLRALFQKGYASITKQPGWLHVVDKNYAHDAGNPGTDENDIPANSTTEIWYFIDQNGLVSQSVSWMRDTAGALIQSVVYQDGIFANSPYGVTGSSPPYPLQFDQDLWRSFRYVSSDHLGVASEETDFDGLPCLKVRFIDLFTDLVKLNGETVATVRMDKEYWVSLETGRILQTQTIYFRADGSQTIGGFRELIFEYVETSPQEVQDALSR